MKRIAAWERVGAEMLSAAAARSRGNEGRARVCARRAVGAALAAHWSIPEQANAYELLLRAASSTDLPEAVRLAAQRLSVRVTEAHRLPHDQDPLEDARSVLAWLGYDLRSGDLQPAEDLS